MSLSQLKLINTDALSLLATALLIFFSITLSSFGTILESSMPAHVLIEIPLLIVTGMMIAKVFFKPLIHFFSSVNRGGIFGILLATVVLIFWMIPRWLDASLTNETVAWAKYITLPLFVGIPLFCSWPLLHPIARGVVKIEFLSMLFRLGWLYIISPDRLCNNYLINDQELLGKGFLIIGFILSIAWLIPVFFGDTLNNNSLEKNDLEDSDLKDKALKDNALKDNALKNSDLKNNALENNDTKNNMSQPQNI